MNADGSTQNSNTINSGTVIHPPVRISFGKTFDYLSETTGTGDIVREISHTPLVTTFPSSTDGSLSVAGATATYKLYYVGMHSYKDLEEIFGSVPPSSNNQGTTQATIKLEYLNSLGNFQDLSSQNSSAAETILSPDSSVSNHFTEKTYFSGSLDLTESQINILYDKIIAINIDIEERLGSLNGVNVDNEEYEVLLIDAYILVTYTEP